MYDGRVFKYINIPPRWRIQSIELRFGTSGLNSFTRRFRPIVANWISKTEKIKLRAGISEWNVFDMILDYHHTPNPFSCRAVRVLIGLGELSATPAQKAIIPAAILPVCLLLRTLTLFRMYTSVIHDHAGMAFMRVNILERLLICWWEEFIN